MLVSYNWLKKFVEIKLSPEKLAEKLTLLGLEVEKVVYPGKGIQKIVVGRIIEIKKHPQADRLQVVKVDIGKKVINVVCGAFNIKKGDKVPVALPGAVLSGKFNKLVIQKAKFRGVESEGMLCAEDELGIGDDHSGIYLLDKGAKIGADIREVLELKNEAVFELDIPANRADCWSHLGVAREIAALLGKELKNKEIVKLNRDNFQRILKNNPGSKKIPSLEVEIKDKNFCPKYTARVIRKVKIKESPSWLKNKLLSLGLRPINNVVDITNYLMLELGQPLHAFDGEKVDKGRKSKKIIVRKARRGEKILTLDGKLRELDNSIYLIADSQRPLAIAGIIGGEESEITHQTKEIILESAQFNPLLIRRASRKLGLRTESSARFERGVDWNMTETALERATEMIEKIAQGKPVKERIYLSDKPIYLRRVIKLPLNFVSKLLGIKIEKKRIKKILLSLGFNVAEFIPSSLSPYEAKNILIKEAKKVLGKKYKYGAKENEAPNYFDCSLLAKYLYSKLGFKIPRSSIEQIELGERVGLKKLQPGDLIFTRGNSHFHYSVHYPKGVSHLGIYLGKDKVIHANGDKKNGRLGVVEQTLKEFLRDKEFIEARRIIGQKDAKEMLIVTVPSWREDIRLPIDLVEEIGRIFDYNKMKPSQLITSLKLQKPNERIILKNKLRHLLISSGFNEVYNYSFQKEGNEKENILVINPLNPNQRYLRRSLLFHLFENIQENLKRFNKVKVFEIGRVYFPQKDNLPKEEEKVAFAFGAVNKKLEEKFFLIKGTFSLIFDRLGLNQEKIVYQKRDKDIVIKLEKKEIGKIVFSDDLVGGELDFNLLLKNKKEKSFHPFSPYPSIRRDLAILVKKDIFYQEIEKTIKEVSPLIKKIELFDVFESEKLGKDKRSLAFHLDFQASDRTLTTEEGERIFKKIVDKLRNKFGAELRG